MTEERLNPLQWLQSKFASLVHTHNDTEINSSYTNIETSTLVFSTVQGALQYNEPFTRINRALEHMITNWDDYD